MKKLQTRQVPAEDFAKFTQHLQMVAFATKTCGKLCQLLGYVVLDGTICQVMQLYQRSLQQLLATPAGERMHHIPLYTFSICVLVMIMICYGFALLSKLSQTQNLLVCLGNQQSWLVLLCDIPRQFHRLA